MIQVYMRQMETVFVLHLSCSSAPKYFTLDYGLDESALVAYRNGNLDKKFWLKIQTSNVLRFPSILEILELGIMWI